MMIPKLMYYFYWVVPPLNPAMKGTLIIASKETVPEPVTNSAVKPMIGPKTITIKLLISFSFIKMRGVKIVLLTC